MEDPNKAPAPQTPETPAQPIQPDPENSIDVAEVKSMLNLPETANDIEVITVLVNLVANLQEKYEAMLADAQATEKQMANADLKKYPAIVNENNHDFWLDQILTNRDKTISLLDEIQGKMTPPEAKKPEPEEPRRIPLRNRAIAQPITSEKVIAKSEKSDHREIDRMATKIRNRAIEIKEKAKIPYIVAFRQAEYELNQE